MGKVRLFGIFGAITLKIVFLIVFKYPFNNYAAISKFIRYKQILLTNPDLHTIAFNI